MALVDRLGRPFRRSAAGSGCVRPPGCQTPAVNLKILGSGWRRSGIGCRPPFNGLVLVVDSLGDPVSGGTLVVPGGFAAEAEERIPTSSVG
jgi:hypothetical protein